MGPQEDAAKSNEVDDHEHEIHEKQQELVVLPDLVLDGVMLDEEEHGHQEHESGAECVR